MRKLPTTRRSKTPTSIKQQVSGAKLRVERPSHSSGARVTWPPPPTSLRLPDKERGRMADRVAGWTPADAAGGGGDGRVEIDSQMVVADA